MNTSKIYREIVEDIRRTALDFPGPEDDERFTCVTRHGTRLRCINSREAICRLAGKYEKAAKRNPFPPFTNKNNTGFSFSAALNRFIEDREIENAIALAESCDKQVYFFLGRKEPWLLKSAQLLEDERFALGNTGSAWTVTHLASGEALGAGTNKKEALANHSRKISKRTKEEIDALLKQASCDFQTTAKSHFTPLSEGDPDQSAQLKPQPGETAMLEQRIEELTAVVNNLIEVIQGSAAPVNTAPAKAEKAPAKTAKGEEKQPKKPKAEPEKVADAEDVRAALIDLSKAKGKNAAKKLLAAFDAAKVGDLKKSDYEEIINVAAHHREAA